MAQQHLFLFQIGPVQSFIATARRTQDLYVGSRLLSDLAATGIALALSLQADMVFPMVKDHLPQSVPHRFAFISDREPKTMADAIQDRIESRWKDLANGVKKWLTDSVGLDTAWHSQFDDQIDKWLEFYWVAVPYQADHHAKAYQQAGMAMAARKQLRTFAQVNEPGAKCTLSGSQSALTLDWEKLQGRVGDTRLRGNERLGAVAMVKRFLPSGLEYSRQIEKSSALKDDFEDLKRFPDIETIAGKGNPTDDLDDAYFVAVLHMDGDRMGQRLSAIQSAQAHRELSQKLTEFAEQTVPAIIKKYNQGNHSGTCQLIYAGGDDVLALLPLWAALECAFEIQTAFNKIDTTTTMSAGIAITPIKYPLDAALDEARAAEKQAKEQYKRNAIVVREVHRSAQIREMGGKWGIVPMVLDLQKWFTEKHLSGKLGYNLLELAHDLVEDNKKDLAQVPANKKNAASNDDAVKISAEARAAEAGRWIARRLNPTTPKDKQTQIHTDLKEALSKWGEDPEAGWHSVAHWTILARFLAKNGQRGE